MAYNNVFIVKVKSDGNKPSLYVYKCVGDEFFMDKCLKHFVI